MFMVCGMACSPVLGEEPRPALPRIEAKSLHNAYWIAPGVASGAQPAEEASFAALKALGVRTVITVDGTKPDVGLAAKHGLRYVHLPIGYDGVPTGRGEAMAKALTELSGPFYIHCHHGKHRGPAAAAVACVITGKLTHEQATAAMKTLGTGANYVGLWESVKNAKPATQEALAKLKAEFPATNTVPTMADAMTHVDDAFDKLRELKGNRWKPLATHPDLEPPHEALKLRELYFELLRSDESKAWSALMKAKFQDGQNAAEALETAMRAKDMAASDAAFEQVKNNCAACHKEHRDKPKAK